MSNDDPKDVSPADDDGNTVFIGRNLPPLPSKDDDSDDRTIIGGHNSTYDQTITQAQPTQPTHDPLAAPAPQMSSQGPVYSGYPETIIAPGMEIKDMYRVEHSLDQGGMGRVFRGIEIHTGRAIAIKVILPEMAEEQKVADMFRREAQTLGDLHHDAIVRYFAYIPPHAGLNAHAIVMGFIEGTKLSDRLRHRGHLSAIEVCTLFRRLADGLKHAHQNGVVHRDLSPDNVMLLDDEIEKAVLIDFGISRSVKFSDDALRDEFGGKLKYVSPEQLTVGVEVDGRSDVYSLGLLMIAALTGSAIRMGDTIEGAVMARRTVPDLSMVPATFQPLLNKMLQPDLVQRLPDMNRVISILDDIAAGSSGFTTQKTGTSSLVSEHSSVLQLHNNPVEGLQSAPSFTGQIDASGKTNQITSSHSNTSREEPAKHSFFVALFVFISVAGGVAIVASVLWYFVSNFDLEATKPVPTGLQRVDGSTETFLAETIEEALEDPATECGYATLRRGGVHTGQIEVIGTPKLNLGEIRSGYQQKFGEAPEVIFRPIGTGQCPAVVLALTYQGTIGPVIELALDNRQIRRGEEIAGSIDGSNGRVDWLVVVPADGGSYSLLRQLDPAIGANRRFHFTLPSAPPGNYLLFAVSSDTALPIYTQMKNGDPASVIFKRLEGALENAGSVAVNVATINLID